VRRRSSARRSSGRNSVEPERGTTSLPLLPQRALLSCIAAAATGRRRCTLCALHLAFLPPLFDEASRLPCAPLVRLRGIGTRSREGSGTGGIRRRRRRTSAARRSRRCCSSSSSCRTRRSPPRRHRQTGQHARKPCRHFFARTGRPQRTKRAGANAASQVRSARDARGRHWRATACRGRRRSGHVALTSQASSALLLC
jgi:hypothetical protein